MIRRSLSIIAALIGLSAVATAQEAAVARTENVEARLVAEREGAAPGGTLSIALRLAIREHWHTYWTYPGDSGEATAVEWTLPPGVTAGALQFPYPERIAVGPLVNFGYEGTVLHLTDMRIPADARPGDTLSFKADVAWLVCAEVCIPEEASLTLDVPVVAGAPAVNAQAEAEFAETRAALPTPSPWPARFSADKTTLAFALDAPELAAAGIASVALFPREGGYIKNAAPQTVETGERAIVVRVEAGRRFSTPERAARVTHFPVTLVVTDRDGAATAFDIDAAPGEIPAMMAAPVAATAGGEGGLSVWTALGFAFLGGLILNLMPCVFPVLSMKALALAKKGGDPATARRGGAAYAAGVIVSFLALAAALLAFRQAGAAVGWGFQLQTPLVVATLALVFFLIGLNLMGVFEVGGRAQNAVAGVGKGAGLGGSFMTGVVAAVVAAPCTAPFMAGAIGAAMAQPAPVALAIFGALGAGMAAPYVALTLSPGLVRRMPKPGPWMERLKQFLAFPMFGSAVWLLWVLTIQTGPNGLAMTLAAFVLAGFAAWLWGLSQRGEGGWLTRGAAGAALAAAVAGLAFMPQGGGGAQAMAGAETGGPKSEAYTPARLDALRAEGKPVFVNLTAAWCVTCLVNEEVALSSDALARAFEAAGIVYLKGDWTNRDPDITALLERHGRAGVPLYLYYAPRAAAPVILPQLLTEGIVLDAIAPQGA